MELSCPTSKTNFSFLLLLPAISERLGDIGTKDELGNLRELSQDCYETFSKVYFDKLGKSLIISPIDEDDEEVRGIGSSQCEFHSKICRNFPLNSLLDQYFTKERPSSGSLLIRREEFYIRDGKGPFTTDPFYTYREVIIKSLGFLSPWAYVKGHGKEMLRILREILPYVKTISIEADNMSSPSWTFLNRGKYQRNKFLAPMLQEIGSGATHNLETLSILCRPFEMELIRGLRSLIPATTKVHVQRVSYTDNYGTHRSYESI